MFSEIYFKSYHFSLTQMEWSELRPIYQLKKIHDSAVCANITVKWMWNVFFHDYLIMNSIFLSETQTICKTIYQLSVTQVDLIENEKVITEHSIKCYNCCVINIVLFENKMTLLLNFTYLTKHITLEWVLWKHRLKRKSKEKTGRKTTPDNKSI